jgi:Predicted nucleotide-binding protein containing TIR-like domain
MKPKIFISHCERNFGPTDYAIRIIDALGCIPVVAEKQPKLSRNVGSLVKSTLDSCDAVIVIATPDDDSPMGKTPSQAVSVEIGRIQEIKKFENRYVIIKEETVKFGSMIPEVYYKFTMNDYGPIAEAILIELGSMGLFKNHYELRGSELQIQKFMDTLADLRDLFQSNLLNEDGLKEIIDKLSRQMIDLIKRGCENGQQE